jgi:hypothetical protein
MWKHVRVCVLLCPLLIPFHGVAQIFSNLQALVYQVQISSLSTPQDGPKGIATADFDGDGKQDMTVANTDGSVVVFFGTGGGRFTPGLRLPTFAGSLRGIVCADFNGDGRADIAVAAPFTDQIILFLNQNNRSFAPATILSAWHGVRNLAVGDFDGDGRPDLIAAGPNNGVRQYRNTGGGSFSEVTNFGSINFSFPELTKFPKPVYALKTFRPSGATNDQLVVSHAETNRIWLLTPNQTGALQIQGSITSILEPHSLDVGPLLNPTNSPLNDLVSVQRDAGTLEIHAAANTPDGFDPIIHQRIDVPGGPRAVEIVDLNGDGWNDLVVVQRNLDSILTYVSSNGFFRLATERPVGTSPRELAAIRLDDDDYSDVVVMNRGSTDISVLLAYPQQAGFRGIDHLYLVDGNVAGLAVFDFNHDGRDDVIQLHRASGDFSVRLADPKGALLPPVFYTVGNVPAAQVVADVNHDGFPDQITANLGTIKIEKSSVSVRLNNGDGTFRPEQRFYVPDGVEGRLFALVPGDFDGDGNIDLAVGFLDSQIAFFKGDGLGNLTYRRSFPFLTQARGLIAADFDRDGDLDLAGVGISGEMWLIENQGTLMTTNSLVTQKFPPPPNESFGGRTIIVTTNSDGFLDIIIGSGKGAWRYTGIGPPGIRFLATPTRLAGTAESVSSMLLKDLDGDGIEDLVLSCRQLDCISVFTRLPNGNFAFAQTLDAPASRFLATGDLDGDGKPDLVGSGRILWTALSGATNNFTAPLTLAGQRRGIAGVVINEVLAENDSLPIDLDGDRVSEWVELYNGGTSGLQMNGWRLQYTPVGGTVHEYTFPNTFFFSPGQQRLLICAETNRTPYHTGFKLANQGGTLSLINASGVEVDRVSYPPQQEAVSYARFKDGLRSFVFNPYPTPGRPNVASGLVEPILKFTGVDLQSFEQGVAPRIFAQAQAEAGISSVTLYYQLLGDSSSRQLIQLYDDGLHGDGASDDGIFAGDLIGAFPPGSEVEFYFEAIDLNDQIIQVPDEVEFTTVAQAGTAYQLAWPDGENNSIELSEIVPLNGASLMDETGGNPDWVEVRNISATPLPLKGFALSHQIGDSARYYFPTGAVLMPGEYFVVYCDENDYIGPLHAPFRLNASADVMILTGTTPNNSRTLIDRYEFQNAVLDEAFARIGAGGPWRRTTPTPRACNVPTWMAFTQGSDSSSTFTFAFATAPNHTYTVEHKNSLDPTIPWYPIQTFIGDGIEKTITQSISPSGFFRVRMSE